MEYALKEENQNVITFGKLTNDEAEVKTVVDIWYSTSIVCHDFVGSEFWKACIDDMKNIYIPSSQTIVSRYNGEIVGFISLVDNTLASIFVLPDYQGKGIGHKLLSYVFEEKETLVLNVYEKNISAREFYLRNGFIEQKRSVDEHTGEIEITMVWSLV